MQRLKNRFLPIIQCNNNNKNLHDNSNKKTVIRPGTFVIMKHTVPLVEAQFPREHFRKDTELSPPNC